MSGDATTACVDIGGAGALANSVATAANEANGGSDIRMRQRQLTTVRLPGYTGANNDNTAVQNFLLGRNPSATTLSAANTVSTGGGGFVNTSPAGSACPRP